MYGVQSIMPVVAPPQRGSPPRVKNPRIADREKRFLHGVIIGRTKDQSRHYLFYSASVGLTMISSEVKDLFIGQWLGIHTTILEFQGNVLLDDSNSEGFDERDDLPDPRFTYVKFYPTRTDPNEGEVVITCRFRVSVNHQSGCFEVISYDVEYCDLIDEYKLVQLSSHWYEGRNFIVEAQASTNGWVVLKVHEDYLHQYSCDAVRLNGKLRLTNPLVHFNTQFLEDCDPPLLTIMVGDGRAPGTSNGPSPQAFFEQHAGDRGQNQPSTSTSSQNVYSEVSDVELRQIESSMSRATITNEPRPETPLTSVSVVVARAASTSRQKTPTPPASREPEPARPSEPKEESDDDLDEEDSEGTRGTDGFVSKEFIKEVAGETYARMTTDRALTGNKAESALCVVVQKINRIAIMWTAKRNVQNVLLYEQECEGLREPLRLGQVTYFEISPRRVETQDALLPRIPYSHIAVRMKPFEPSFNEKIDRFQSQVRTFGNLVEMKVTIELTQPQRIEIFNYQSNESSLEKDKSFYFLHATNGVRVSIPSERLVPFVNSDYRCEFDLVAWATHRKPVGTVSLHIGRSGEAYRKYKNGKMEELPPLSDTEYLMNVKKR